MSSFSCCIEGVQTARSSVHESRLKTVREPTLRPGVFSALQPAAVLDASQTEPNDTAQSFYEYYAFYATPLDFGLRRTDLTLAFCVPLEKKILAGLPADGLVIQTDDPNLEFGNDGSVSAVDACSGLEVEVVSCHHTSYDIHCSQYSGVG